MGAPWTPVRTAIFVSEDGPGRTRSDYGNPGSVFTTGRRGSRPSLDEWSEDEGTRVSLLERTRPRSESVDWDTRGRPVLPPDRILSSLSCQGRAPTSLLFSPGTSLFVCRDSVSDLSTETIRERPQKGRVRSPRGLYHSDLAGLGDGLLSSRGTPHGPRDGTDRSG